MSDAVSALNLVNYEGLVQVSEIGLQGMITLRGDLNATAVKAATNGATGVKIPTPNAIHTSPSKTGPQSSICWMSPDEVLILCAYKSVEDTLTKMQQTLAQTHSLAVNVSDARAVFQISGGQVRTVMAKLCPVDFSPEAFTPGLFRRSRMAQVPAAFWMPDDQTFQIICFRSVADYVFELLKTAAQPHSEIECF